MYDIIVIGGGPAGLNAGLYARRANKSVLIIEKGAFGGQITFSPKVENLPGFKSVTGNEFAEQVVDQLLYQGADFESAEVLSVTDGETKVVHTDGGDYEAKAVIVATGAKHRLLGLPKETDFIGEGISFCAVCDGAFYQNKTVGVVGGGNSAMQEAVLLSDGCKKVYMFQNLDTLTGEKKLQEQIAQKDNIEVITGVTVKELLGDKEFSGVVLQKNDGSTLSYDLDGLFVAIGLVPQNEIVQDLIELNAQGYSVADETCVTKTKGVYVAGDCRVKKSRQVITAMADGAVAALSACEYIDNL